MRSKVLKNDWTKLQSTDPEYDVIMREVTGLVEYLTKITSNHLKSHGYSTEGLNQEQINHLMCIHKYMFDDPFDLTDLVA